MIDKKIDDGSDSHLSKVRAFFTRRSYDYKSDSSSFPWSWLRKREGAAVEIALGPVDGQTVLDLGAGAGQYSLLALKQGAKHVVAVDLSGEMLQNLSNSGVTLVIGDAAQCELSQSFETIICAGMLEFVPDAAAVFANARRHSTAQGALVVLAPATSLGGALYQLYHRRNGLSITTFTKERLIEMGKKAGWELQSYKFVGPFTHVVRFGVEE